MSGWRLAEINIATLKAPIDAPETAEFVAALDPINALAEAQPGFVWRLKGEGNDATDLKAFDNPLTILNMSVWTDAEALAAYVYRTGHREILRRSAEWMEKVEVSFALWWVPVGHEPTPAEGIERMEILRRSGPSPAAFTFKDLFPAPTWTLRVVPNNREEGRRILEYFAPRLQELSHQPVIEIGDESDPYYVMVMQYLDRGMHVYLRDEDDPDSTDIHASGGWISVTSPGGAEIDPILWSLYYHYLYLQMDDCEIVDVVLRADRKMNPWKYGED